MTFSILLFALLLAVSVFLFALMGYRLFTQAAVRYEERFRESAEANLKDLFIFIDPQKLFLFNLGILVVSAFLIWAMSGNLLVSVLVAAALAACPRMVYSVLRARRERSFSYALPDSMASVASMLRAGSNLQSALELMVKESSGPIRQEFGLLLRAEDGRGLQRSPGQYARAHARRGPAHAHRRHEDRPGSGWQPGGRTGEAG